MSDCIDKLQNEIDELKKDHKKLMSGSERGSSSSSSSSSSGSERKEQTILFSGIMKPRADARRCVCLLFFARMFRAGRTVRQVQSGRGIRR